jgi:hypothetical protein
VLKLKSLKGQLVGLVVPVMLDFVFVCVMSCFSLLPIPIFLSALIVPIQFHLFCVCFEISVFVLLIDVVL